MRIYSKKQIVVFLIILTFLIPITIFAKGLKETADDLLNKGASYYNEGNLEQALDSFDKCIELDRANKKAWTYKAYALRDLKRYTEEVKAWDEYVKLNPKSPAAWTNRGIALCYINKYSEGMISFGKAIEIDPKAPQIYWNRGFFKSWMGNYKEALADLNEAKRFGCSESDIDSAIKALNILLRQIDGKGIPPEGWRPNYGEYHTIYEDFKPGNLMVYFMAEKWEDMPAPKSGGGAVSAAGLPGTKASFKGTQEEPLAFAPNFYVWGGAYINDPKFGVLLEEGTKFKHIKIEGDYKYIRIGVIKNWKAVVLSEKKVKVEEKQ